MIPDKEFGRMEFNPTSKKQMFQVYPKLSNILGAANDKLVRYVLLMYDIKSPLKDHYPDLQKRKEIAAMMSGYDMDKDDVTGIFEFKTKDDEGEYIPHDELLNITIAYLKYQNNWVWSMVVSNEQAFYEYNKRVMMPVDGSRDKDILQAINIKTQIMEAQDAIYNRLQKYYKDMAGGDTDLEQAIVSRKRMRPEEIANNVR
jgi:hypothetical protein